MFRGWGLQFRGHNTGVRGYNLGVTIQGHISGVGGQEFWDRGDLDM